MPTTTIAHWDELPAEDSQSVRRTLFAGAGADLKRVVIPAGTHAARHEHPHEQFLLVLAGSATLTTAEGSRPLGAGMVVRLEPNAWHEARFHADTVLVEVNLAV